ncbi:MAG: GTPase HflX [Hyphomonadaceae bacterium]|nr:GTPase HflX [Hyphomonadaceae bacterium]
MTAVTPDLSERPERAGAVIPWVLPIDRPSEDRLRETAGLVEALGCELVFLDAMHLRRPSPSHLLSGGHLADLKTRLETEACSICIVDGALSPVQQRNLERELGVKVIDRTGLILEIFGLRARTREGQLQVELARISYERSRLVRTWTHLERQRGGRGFLSGPGETQLEADRRMLDRTMKRLRSDLEDVRRTRGLQREGRARAGTPVISLVGYTNAGKSTLFNRLAGATVLAKDMPFATLDPTIRRIDLPVIGDAALVDTVGFITDLPTHLIDAFQATLEEAVESDLLIHVRDRASESDEVQRADVLKVLAHLEEESGKPLPPLIEAWNKADAVAPDRRDGLRNAAALSEDPPAVLVSALTGEGMEDLVARIEAMLLRGTREYTLLLSPRDGRARAWLHAHGDVTAETALETGDSRLNVRLTEATRGQFAGEFPELDLI